MTVRTRSLIKSTGIVGLVVAGAISGIFGGLKWTAARAFAAADGTYEHVEDFRRYKDSVRLRAYGDSINNASDRRWMIEHLTRVEQTTDAILNCQRHPHSEVCR